MSASPSRSQAAAARGIGGLTFVILCMGRTGSTHLQFLLDSHPDVRCFGELFTGNAGTLDEVFLTSDFTDPVEYVAQLTSGLDEQAVGFKLPMGSIRACPGSLRVLDDPGLRIIRLTRGNKLSILVSRRLLATTRVPQSTHGSYGEATVRLDPRQCVRALAKIEEHDAYLDELADGHPTLHVTYEDLVARRDLDRLQEFVGVEPTELSSIFERVRKRSLAETVENWPEIEAVLRGTQFEAFLADDLS
jgi:hypothetical protein